MRTTSRRALTAVIGFISATGSARAGAPLICHAVEIGNAKSIAATDGATDLTPRDVVDQTLAILDGSTPVLVRMETLRRAATYVSREKSLVAEGVRAVAGSERKSAADDLLARLQKRAADADASGHPDALAIFDAGYLSEVYSQCRIAENLDGYAWVKRAHDLRRDPEISYALALMCLYPQRPDRDQYLREAVMGASAGSLLEKNLDETGQHWSWGTIAELRTRYSGPAR